MIDRAIAYALILAGLALPAAAAERELAPLATPEGFTIQPLGLAQGYSLSKESATKLPRAQIVYASGEGMTLYTYDQDQAGKSSCTGECAKTWPPLLAAKDAKPVTGWSVILRDDGSRQWAHDNKPLYTFSGDVDIGSVGGNSPKRFGRGPLVGPRGITSRSIPKDKPLPDGWHAAMLYPASPPDVPGNFSIREVEDAMALTFVDERTGRTLYAFEGDPKKAEKACASQTCRDLWTPMEAPLAAAGKGDFTAVVRDDGITQWAYKGRALFTYSGDLSFGDANGIGVDKRWEVAAYLRYFLPANATLRSTHKLGRVLATANGMTLYRRNSHIFQSGGGHSLRRGDPVRPAVGRDLGTDPHCSHECDLWHPFLAPANAKPWADWTVLTRADGSKQWASRGYALWTYDGDKKPGDINGNDSYEIKMSHDANTVLDIGTPYDGPWALLWIAAYP